MKNIIEKLYNIKKLIILFFKKLFSVDYPYTCILPDKLYCEKLYQKRTGQKLNVKHPETYNDKLNWLKLYYRKPIYTVMADKYASRKYIEDKVGAEYLVPLVNAWDKVEDIDFDALPDKFVLKCNHGNGVVICRDKTTFDVEKAKAYLSENLKKDYYRKLREWPYKNIKRKIICEELLENKSGEELYDYKFFVFNGEIKMMYIGSNKADPEFECFNFYDADFNPLDIKNGHPINENGFEKPEQWEKMMELAKILTADCPMLRVDFYLVDGKIYCGEMTFYHYGGMRLFEPGEWYDKIGSWLTLPTEKYNT